MLADEYGTASNIKSRVNRLSVLGAITSVQHRLKLYSKVPPNGLVSEKRDFRGKTWREDLEGLREGLRINDRGT